MRSPQLALSVFSYRQALRRLNWQEAHRQAIALLPLIEKSGDRTLLNEFGFGLLRFQEDVSGLNLLIKHRTLTTAQKRWDGAELNGKELIIDTIVTEKQGLAVGLNAARYIGSAAALCKSCIVVCHPRLQSLFQRSFPHLQITTSRPSAKSDEKPLVAENLDLAYYFAKHPEKLESTALQANKAVTDKLREQYDAGRGKPLIGVAWYSSHKGKESPPLSAWQKLLSDDRFIFVSLQYGDIQRDLAVLKQFAGKRLIVDETVDQMVDMDRFASQVDAMDAIVSISNTGAHLANALNKKMFLLRDDEFRRNWPVLGERVDIYPHLTVIGKNGRPWADVLQEVLQRLLRT